MLGEPFTITYPDEDLELVQADVIPDLEETGVWSGETTGVRADGSTFVEDHTLAKTKDGELICSVWDKSERKSRERAIEGLHSTVRSFMQATSVADVARTVTEAMRDILDLPAAAMYRYDEDEDCLRPTVWTEETEAILGEPPAFSREEGIAWQVFERGERQVYDDVSTAEDRLNEDTLMRSEMILPLGDHGVLLVGVDDADAFETTDVPSPRPSPSTRRQRWTASRPSATFARNASSSTRRSVRSRTSSTFSTPTGCSAGGTTRPRGGDRLRRRGDRRPRTVGPLFLATRPSASGPR